MADELLREWFELRFRRKPEHDESYYREWQNRFSQGEWWAEKLMDDESKAKWRYVKKYRR